MILREHTVVLFDLQHFPFGGGYSLGVLKTCFQEWNRSWQAFLPYLSILPDVWQDLGSGHSPQGIECIKHLRLLVRNAGGLVSYDHSELSYPASQLSAIRS